MEKKIIITAVLITSLFFITTTYAYDLPIDINTIGRQEAPTSRVTHRIGANLFTEDARYVNYLLARQIYQRQETALTLFETVLYSYEISPQIRVMTTANELDLFSQPINFATFNTVQEMSGIQIWHIVVVLFVCSMGGFVLALHSIEKRRRSTENVH